MEERLSFQQNAKRDIIGKIFNTDMLHTNLKSITGLNINTKPQHFQKRKKTQRPRAKQRDLRLKTKRITPARKK